MTLIKVEDIPVVLPPPTLSTGSFTNLGYYTATARIQNAQPQPFIIAGDKNTQFVAESGYQYRCRVLCTIGDKTYYGAYFYFTAVFKQGTLESDKDK